jgi:AraC family transcriptional regulator
MKPGIEILQPKKLVGYKIQMSMTENKTGELWKRFVPKIKDIKGKVSDDKISMQIYDDSYFRQFNPHNTFEKWATVKVKDFAEIPQDMYRFELIGGKYAVFDYKGLSNDNRVFQYIFGTWLPNSDYQIDNRPHFEVLGENYKNNHPDSEEEIWIPIKSK